MVGCAVGTAVGLVVRYTQNGSRVGLCEGAAVGDSERVGAAVGADDGYPVHDVGVLMLVASRSVADQPPLEL